VGTTPLTKQRKKPRVLVFAGYYLPGYKAGGPIRSIRNVVGGLGEECDFRILTSDRDYRDATAYANVPLNCWTPVEGAQVFYADRRHRGIRSVLRVLQETNPDIVYLNSFFSGPFSIALLALRRLGLTGDRARWIIAPRGEFSAGALEIKGSKKRAFMRLASVVGLHRDLIWQATSREEAADIVKQVNVPTGAVRLVPNLTEAVGAYGPPVCLAGPAEPLKVCFLSRVSPKKNLRFAIEVLRQVDRPTHFHVYGPVEDEAYAAECRALGDSAGSTLNVCWHGDVSHEKVRSVLGQHHLFLLPTLGENFGHAIFESLAAGVPVLISDQTPWRDIEARGAGWAKPLSDQQGFIKVLEHVADLSIDQRKDLAINAHEYALDFWRSSNALSANRELFQ
jgi:glycosyltransferase involved in cell wall biosynthesis